MKSPGKVVPILIGTLVVVVISSFPIINLINFFFCAGVILGAVAGVYYFNKKLAGTGTELTYKDGAVIGGMSGLLSAVLFILIVILAVLFLKLLDVNLGLIIKDIYNRFGVGGNKFSKKMIDEYSQNGYSITHMILITIIYGIFYPLFGLAGGILGSAIFIKKNKKAKSIII